MTANGITLRSRMRGCLLGGAIGEVISTIADDLATYPEWDAESDDVWERYPGW